MGTRGKLSVECVISNIEAAKAPGICNLSLQNSYFILYLSMNVFNYIFYSSQEQVLLVLAILAIKPSLHSISADTAFVMNA